MNSREHLLADIIDLEDIQANPETVAALRELDQLLMDAVKLANAQRFDWIEINQWRQRAAQAGYGEK